MPTIIWDWNGTLLNDLDLCIETINTLLNHRSLPALNGKRYKEVFSFPVKKYYETIGFDFSREDFAIPAAEFINAYNAKLETCSLQKGSIEVLRHFERNGCKQYILSAMKQNTLDHCVDHFGLKSYFKGVYGLGDHYAHSKMERGKQLIEAINQKEKEQIWMIGDTLHDYEVAQELNINCILVSDGHQSYERLKKTGVKVLNQLAELPQWILRP